MGETEIRQGRFEACSVDEGLKRIMEISKSYIFNIMIEDYHQEPAVDSRLLSPLSEIMRISK